MVAKSVVAVAFAIVVEPKSVVEAMVVEASVAPRLRPTPHFPSRHQ